MQYHPIASITLKEWCVVMSTTLQGTLFFIVQIFIMSESDLLEVLENEEIIAKVTKFLSLAVSLMAQNGSWIIRGSGRRVVLLT